MRASISSLNLAPAPMARCRWRLLLALEFGLNPEGLGQFDDGVEFVGGHAGQALEGGGAFLELAGAEHGSRLTDQP